MTEMPDFCVTGATEADIPTVKEVAHVCFSDPWSEQSLRASLGAIFLLLTHKEKTVGFCIVSVSADEAELYDIAVLPQYRGTGGAALLIDEALKKARALGALTVYLEVRESNARAIGFYEKHGFVRIGMRKNYYKSPPENAILMSLDLNERQ